MAEKESQNFFHQFRDWIHRDRTSGDSTGSHCRQGSSQCFTTESRILNIQKAKRAALIQQANTLYAAQRARNDAVRQRMGISVQDNSLPSCQLPSFPSRSTKSLLRRVRFAPCLDEPYLNVEDLKRNQMDPKSLDEDSWMEVSCGSQMAVLAYKEAQMADDGDKSSTASISSLYSFRSVDTQTPCELRAISLIRSPVEVTPDTPTPPSPRAAPLSHLPVFSAKHSGADRKVVDGIKLLTAKDKLGSIVEKLEHFQHGFITSPGHPVAAKSISAVKPLGQTPPTVPYAKQQGLRRGTFLRHATAVPSAGNKAASKFRLRNAREGKVELPPLAKPVESLSFSFSLLSSDDWIKKMEGLKTIQALATHHSDILKTKLHEVCLVLIEEVKNLRSAVSCQAIRTLNELYVQLQKTMDPEVERTGRALLLKLAEPNSAFIHQEVNLALDAMVKNCSHGQIFSALFNTGLNHRCVAVRSSTAEHLHQLTDKLGAAHILKAGRNFRERFLIAASKMAGDAAPEVKYHGRIVIQKLAVHKDFLNLWIKIVPEKDRHYLNKIVASKA